MPFGIDSLEYHLDLFASEHRAEWTALKAWNGGDPSFAGRNFLGGRWQWVQSEATDANTNPNPANPGALSLWTNAIAPVQAPMPARQSVAGQRGFLYGAIDAQALCRRISSRLFAGELDLPAGLLVDVWLTVDPTAAFSADYWAGWANTTESWLVPGVPVPGLFLGFAPFCACIRCAFVAGAGNALAPDPHVVAAVAQAHTAYPGSLTAARGFWADAAGPAASRRPGWVPDWTPFAGSPNTTLWRFTDDPADAAGNSLNGGSHANLPLAIDAVRDFGAGHPKATDRMLVPQRWQPNAANVQTFGFSRLAPVTANNLANCVEIHDIPALADAGGVYRLPAARTKAIGRYLKTGANSGESLTLAEAKRFAAANLLAFSAWENNNHDAPRLAQANQCGRIAPNTHGGEPAWCEPGNQRTSHIGIEYFNPAHDCGTSDGRAAFSFAHRLDQPPHTPIFFAIDGDAQWRQVVAANAREGDWLKTYFERVRAQRDAFTAANPERPYLIGAYAGARVLEELYKLGIVDMFWQAMSHGWDGSRAAWPWCHANRWQYQGDKNMCARPDTMSIDPDVDWGDGGTWTLADPLLKRLQQLDARQLLDAVENAYNDLLQAL